MNIHINRIIKYVLCKYARCREILLKNIHHARIYYIKKLSSRTMNNCSGYKVVTGFDMEDYFSQVDVNYRDLTNPFQYYRELVDKLENVQNLHIAPVSRLFDNKTNEARVISLRHDVDADPITAIRAARYLASRSVAGSFFLLHTSLYYGSFHNGLFIRNSMLARWINDLIIAGCELGIHNDALGLIGTHQINGVAALITEINWMRSLGANIMGTVAHNSAPVYGAENYEIFRGKVLWGREVKSDNGIKLPLSCINENDIGLIYEGTFARPIADVDIVEAERYVKTPVHLTNPRNPEWMKTYLVDNPCVNWATDIQFWLVGRDQWMIGGWPGNNALFESNVNLETVIKVINELPKSSRAIIVVHPEYIRE